MKNTNKLIISLTLVLAILLSTLPSIPVRAQTSRPLVVEPPQCNVAVGIIVLGIAIYIVYKLAQCAKKVLNPPPPPPPNPPPPQPPPTNHNSQVQIQLDGSAATVYALAGTVNNPDYSDGWGGYWTEIIAYQIETSTNCSTWNPACTVTSWVSSVCVESLVYTNGTCVSTNLSVGPTLIDGGNTNVFTMPVPLWNPGSEPRRFFRMKGV